MTKRVTTTFKRTKRWHLHIICDHCSYGWYPRHEEVPKVCPQCKRELVEVPLG